MFREYDENFAPMSLDEAYMDITDYLEIHGSNPWDVVQVLRCVDTLFYFFAILRSFKETCQFLLEG